MFGRKLDDLGLWTSGAPGAFKVQFLYLLGLVSMDDNANDILGMIRC